MPKQWSKQLAIGDEVSYASVSLWDDRGRIVSFDRGPHGGDCYVSWNKWAHLGRIEECKSNLISWR